MKLRLCKMNASVRSEHTQPKGRPRKMRFIAHPTVVFCSAAFTAEEERQFEHLYKEHWPWAFNQASNFGVSDPEIVASEALRKALLAYDPNKGQFRPFLKVILLWECLSAFRREARLRERLQPLPDDFEPPDERVSRQIFLRELREEIELALKNLSPEDRNLILLIYEENFKYKQIAEQNE